MTALEERAEGGSPEAGFEPQGVKVLWGGCLAVEAKSSTDQTVVAAAVIVAVVVETWPVTGRCARLASRAAGDAGRSCFASGHPGQDHVNQGPQNQAHCHGYTKNYDKRDCEESNTNRIFYLVSKKFVFLSFSPKTNLLFSSL